MQVNDDKKVKTIVKKLGVQPLQAIDEVNFFKDDNTVMHFEKPDGNNMTKFSPRIYGQQYLCCDWQPWNQNY